MIGTNEHPAWKVAFIEEAPSEPLDIPPHPIYMEYLLTHLKHPMDDGYWDYAKTSLRNGDSKVPTYLFAGYFDLFRDCPIKDFLGREANGNQKVTDLTTNFVIVPSSGVKLHRAY